MKEVEENDRENKPQNVKLDSQQITNYQARADQNHSSLQKQ